MVQIKDAIKDGLRAVTNAIEDKFIVPGAGAFEIAVNNALLKYRETVKGKARLGVTAFAEAMLVIPKTLAQNAGHDQQSVLVELHDAAATSKTPVGIDLKTGSLLVLFLKASLTYSNLLVLFKRRSFVAARARNY